MQSLDQEPLLLSFLMTWVLGLFLKSLVMHFLLLPFPSTFHVLPQLWSPLSAPKHYLQFVGGKACKSVAGSSVAVQSPGGSGVLGYCPDGGRKDVRNAVEAASKVQPGWDRHTTSAFNSKSVIYTCVTYTFYLFQHKTHTIVCVKFKT